MEITNAYIAGIIDGEGYIAIFNSCVGKSKKYLKLVVKVAMVDDENLLLSIQEKFGGYIVHRKSRSERHRPTVEWILENGKAEIVLKNIMPYMIVKKKQAEIAIEFRKFVSYNHNITEDVIAYRQHLADGIKGLHHSIPFEINNTLRRKALRDIKTKRFISMESRQRMSKSHEGKHHSGTFKKGVIPWITGKKHSEETKRKIGKSNSIALKGHVPWNKKP